MTGLLSWRSSQRTECAGSSGAVPAPALEAAAAAAENEPDAEAREARTVAGCGGGVFEPLVWLARDR